MNNIQIYNYHNHPVSFDFGGGHKMVNATQMAKPFGKQPAHFLRTNPTKDFISLLIDRYDSNHSDIVKVVNGGTNYGTWMCEELALEFSGWLSPEFKLWMNDRIRELLTTGSTQLQPKSEDETILLAMQTLQRRVAAKDAQIKELQPKAAYTDEVLTSTSTYTVTQLAKDLGFSSARALNQWLHQERIQYKQSGQWLLYAQHTGKGWVETQTYTYAVGDETRTAIQTRWTERGRKMIAERLGKLQLQL